MRPLRSLVLLAAVIPLAVGAGALAQPAPARPLVDAPTSSPATQRSADAYEFRGGRWIPIAPAEGPAATDVTLDRAEDYLQRGGWRAARKLLIRWFETHDKRHPLRDRATFLLAEVYFQQGNRILSFYHFDEVMDLYPESRLYPTALQRQYDIADTYLKGFKDRLFYLSLIGREDEAIEMLFRIQRRAAGSPIAEKALLRSADYYFATSQFDFAADAFGSYVKAFPRSPIAPLAKLKQAYSQMALFRGTRFDATPITDARELLSDLIVTQPELARERGLPANVQRIDDAQARKLLQTGDFYKKTDQHRGAVYLYRLLIRTYPTSEDAQVATQRLEAIPEKYKNDPLPGADREIVEGETSLPSTLPINPSVMPAAPMPAPTSPLRPNTPLTSPLTTP